MLTFLMVETKDVLLKIKNIAENKALNILSFEPDYSYENVSNGNKFYELIIEFNDKNNIKDFIQECKEIVIQNCYESILVKTNVFDGLILRINKDLTFSEIVDFIEKSNNAITTF